MTTYVEAWTSLHDACLDLWSTIKLELTETFDRNVGKAMRRALHAQVNRDLVRLWDGPDLLDYIDRTCGEHAEEVTRMYLREKGRL